MKPPHDPQNQPFNNIPELINHLWGLYSSMSLDPALASFAERLREAVLELERIRRAAWEVCQEERNTGAPFPGESSEKRRSKGEEEAAEWLKSLPCASPLKQ
jgi:hypothetical protein